MATVNQKIDLSALRSAATQACDLLKVMVNPDRMLLLCHLPAREHCVSELAELTGIAQPTLSQQLGVLRAARLVGTRREGNQIYYRIASERALAVMRVLYEQFCRRRPGDRR
jgi:ArsR family transcriptional regulator